jgi:hypothetical protein
MTQKKISDYLEPKETILIQVRISKKLHKDVLDKMIRIGVKPVIADLVRAAFIKFSEEK